MKTLRRKEEDALAGAHQRVGAEQLSLH
jgi:hypothetical protein